MKRRICAMICAVCLLVGLMPAAFAASDINGHWAQKDMQTLSGLGIMKGYTDGTFKPNNSITKAEYITLLNRTFGLTAMQSVSASDLSVSKWYYTEIQKAAAAGYLFTFGGKVKPDEKLTREEAAAMFGRLLRLPTSNAATSFSDNASISSWAKPYIPAVAAAKIISGYPDGSFHPTETITRAEVCRVLMNVCGNFYTTSGSYASMDTSKANATVQAAGVTLSGLNIPGNLYITNAVGTGSVTLHNCTVGGKIMAVGNPGATVYLTGSMNEAVVDPYGLRVVVQGSVEDMTFDSDTAASAQLTVIAGGSVGTLHMLTPGQIIGAVEQLDVRSNGVTAAELPEKWTIPSGLSATLAGKVYTTSGTKGPGFANGYPKAQVRQTAGGQTQEIVVTVKLDEAAKIYAIAVPRGAAAPTAEQVKALSNYAMVAIAGYNFTTVTTTGVELNLTMKDLPLGGSYDVYIVAESLETEPKLGSAVKLSPDVQLFMTGYPEVNALSDSTATVLVKTVAPAEVYMMALPAGSAAPTAQQLYAQSGVSGAVCAKGVTVGGREDSLVISGLTGGPAAYDLYVGAGAAGAAGITTDIAKFVLANTGNSVGVQYSETAAGGMYPGHTILTLRFHDTMYKAGTTTQMGTPGATPAELIVIGGVSLYTGAAVTVSGYTVTDAGGGVVLVTPPTGGWTEGVKYTVSLQNIADAAGHSPVPAQISFGIGSGTAVSAPRFSLATGSTVQPGQTITIATDTPNAVIQYTTDGTDPMVGNFSSQYGSSLTLTIPATAVVGTRYQIRAVTRLDTGYSQVVEAVYTVGQSLLRPSVTLGDAGKQLEKTGETVASGSVIHITSPDPNALIYYTIDGSTPVAAGIGMKSLSLQLTGAVGDIKTVRFLLVSGTQQSEVFTYVFTIGTAVGA